MFAARNAVSRIVQANNTMVMAKRTNVISGPPANKISTLEKVIHGVGIATGLCFIPAWVLANIKHYRGREE